MELNYVLIIGLSILFIDIILRLWLLWNEIRFNRIKYLEEKKVRDEQKQWLESETLKLTEVAKPLAVNIKKELIQDISWLAASMQQVKLGTDSKTLFKDRLGHFEIEKKFIADEFVPLLLERCKQFISENKKVCLIIDSGTSLYDLLDKFSEETVRLSHSQENWIDNILVATNNLPGVQIAMEKGRMNPTDRFSKLSFKCHLFPGEPLSIYAAVTGTETNEAIVQLKQKFSEYVFIGITVGNWIRIRRTQPFCPVPMARGEGHLAFKQTLLNNVDEVFVIAPLGKIFKNVDKKEINRALGLCQNSSNPEKEDYNELEILGESLPNKIKLVTTCRIDKRRLLYVHSKEIETLLNVNQPDHGFDISKGKIEDIKHIMFPFNNLPDDPYFEKETEFPHKITRKPEFMKRFFSVVNI